MYVFLDPTTLLRQRAAEIDRTIAKRQIDRARTARTQSRPAPGREVTGR